MPTYLHTYLQTNIHKLKISQTLHTTQTDIQTDACKQTPTYIQTYIPTFLQTYNTSSLQPYPTNHYRHLRQKYRLMPTNKRLHTYKPTFLQTYNTSSLHPYPTILTLSYNPYPTIHLHITHTRAMKIKNRT